MIEGVLVGLAATLVAICFAFALWIVWKAVLSIGTFFCCEESDFSDGLVDGDEVWPWDIDQEVERR